MPIYEYKCKVCNTIKDEFKAIEERNDCPKCCGKKTTKIISCKIKPDIEPYYDVHMTGEPIYVKSRQHKKRLMKEHDIREKLDYFS